MITHYDLFAGIGGFSYALDQVFYDQEIEHIFCEWEAFPTAVLKKHWPNATYYGDIADLVADAQHNGKFRAKTFREDSSPQSKKQTRKKLLEPEPKRADSLRTSEDGRLTILTGGFPCQPFSHAGRRKGTADDRYKWPEMFAVIRNVQPDWVIAENVRGLSTWNDGMVLETVCADLESEGYETRPYIIPACGKGAPHRRERVWIVANRTSSENNTEHEKSSRPSEQQGRAVEVRRETSRQKNRETCDYRHSRRTWNTDWREVALATCHDGMDARLPRRLDGATYRGKRTDCISAAQHRKERLKACGNAIVPQVAMEIFKAIRQSESISSNVSV